MPEQLELPTSATRTHRQQLQHQKCIIKTKGCVRITIVNWIAVYSRHKHTFVICVFVFCVHLGTKGLLWKQICLHEEKYWGSKSRNHTHTKKSQLLWTGWICTDWTKTQSNEEMIQHFGKDCASFFLTRVYSDEMMNFNSVYISLAQSYTSDLWNLGYCSIIILELGITNLRVGICNWNAPPSRNNNSGGRERNHHADFQARKYKFRGKMERNITPPTWSNFSVVAHQKTN